MKTVSCPACNTVNSADELGSSNCGASLEAAKLEQSINELRKTTEKS